MNEYPFASFYDFLEFHSKIRGSKVALILDKKKVTYEEFLKEVDRLAYFLSQEKISKGDKVALFLRNSLEFVYSIFAISKLGAIVVPINTFLKEEELNFILKDSKAKILIASSSFAKVVNSSKSSSLCQFILWEGDIDIISPKHFNFKDISNAYEQIIPDKNLNDEAVIFYTSGTTGRPKGAILTNKNILSNCDSGKRTIQVTSKDRDIVFLPMFHSFTFSIGIILLLFVGGSIVIIQSLKPFSNIFKETLLKRVTLFLGIPDVYNALSKAKLPWYFLWFNSIRAFVSGVSPLHQKVIDGMSNKFKKATLLEGYGLSEASPAVSMNTFSKQKTGSVGQALYGYKIKIVDEEMIEVKRGEVGDIIIKGDNIMKGYLGHIETTNKTIINGWLKTGDIGYIDSDDFLFIVDRKKDLIISKGINIYPREIEDVISHFKGVKASAVIGVDDENSGEVAYAYLELEEEIDQKELKAYLKEHIANYKIFKKFIIIDELPKNATGKVLKRVLKEQIG